MKLHLSLFLSGLILASAHEVRVHHEKDSRGDTSNHNGSLRASAGHDSRVYEGDAVVSHNERSHDRNHDTGMGDRASGGYDSRVYEGDAVVYERSHDRYHDTSFGERGSHGDFDQRGNGNGNGGNGNNGNGNGNNGKPPAHGRNKIKTKNCNNNSRAPHCDVDLELNLGTNEDLEFTLPNGKTITFKKAPGGNGKGKAWSGDSPSGGRANIIDRVNKDSNEDRYFGSFVDTEDGEWNICHMHPDHGGNHVIDCQPGEDFPDEEEPIRRFLKENEGVKQLVQNSSTDNDRNLHAVPRTIPTIHVMVLWTRNAECQQSGLSNGCSVTSTTESNIRGLIDLAIEETNQAFSDSGINAKYALAHAYRVSYTATSFGAALDALEAGIENSNTLRSEYGADQVAMIIETEGSCGLGNLWTPPAPGGMFSVTRYSCATGYYSFGHELAHNLGAHHDRGTRSACSSGATNFGYRDPNARYRTVMAYNCNSGQCDNNAGGNCPRLPIFSNAFGFTTADGNKAGDSSNNNAGQINSVAATVAAYYSAPPTAAPPTGGGPEECVDVAGWHDSDGSTYNCDWYEQYAPSSCTNYGGSYANFGRTANEACCACNGGVTATCKDVDGWYDADGSTYNCAWYGGCAANCQNYGHLFENFGKTANEACCTCGGGF